MVHLRLELHPFMPRTVEVMRLRNDCYLVTLEFDSGVEHYYRDGDRWTKVTMTGRRMPATAEQVMNHLLPALAGVKSARVRVRHQDVDDEAGQTLSRLRGTSTACS